MILPQLTTLETSGLIRLAQTQPEVEYLFRHALVQEAAYDSLLKNSRRQLHRSVGEVLERLYPDRLASRDLAPLLGWHFLEAGDERRALKYFTLAGDAAARVYANTEAVMHYTQALSLIRGVDSERETLIHLYLSYGHALELSAQDAAAVANYEALETVARARGDRALELDALLAQAIVYLKPVSVRDPAKGQALSERALALARELNNRAAEAKSLWNLMQFFKWSDQMVEAQAWGEQALAIAREFNLRELTAYSLHDLSSVYLVNGQFEPAMTAMLEAQQLWRELGILNMLADNLASYAELHVMTGQYDRAIALSREALQISQTIGNLWNQSYSWYMIDLAYLDRGEIGSAIEVAEECLRLAQQAGFVPGVLQSVLDLTLIYGYLGAVHLGYEVAERSRGWAQGMPMAGLLESVMIARLHLFSGRLADAQAVFGEAQRGIDARSLSAYLSWFTGLVEGELALAAGDYARVLSLTDEAIPFLRQARIRLFFPDVLYTRGKALLGLARTDEAHAAFQEARVEAEAIGSRRSLWSILAALSEIEARRGNQAEAQQLRWQARDIVEFIAEHVGSPELRTSFLNLPDVRDVLRET
ncbi:MAG TPA: hypothetical protein VJG32_14585 [Anaerolineae bacterium]|nr:hypothetical protein [Anaerolineae bacterium]